MVAVDWMDLIQAGGQWRSAVSTVMNRRVSYDARIFRLDKKILHIGLGIEEEAGEMLHLEHSFMWC